MLMVQEPQNTVAIATMQELSGTISILHQRWSGWSGINLKRWELVPSEGGSTHQIYLVWSAGNTEPCAT